MKSFHLISAALFLVACGGPQMRSGELFVGRSSGTPSLQCLPDPDIADDALTPRMRFAMELADSAFEVPRPVPPTSRHTSALTQWSEGPLREWLEQKTRALDAARRELDAAAEENHRQRIMAGAIVGLLYEDLSRTLGELPTPDDLDDEPEILDIYQRSLESQARPFVSHARHAYSACAANATEPAGMRHWARFCADRKAGLPGEELASGTTEVEVIAE